MNDWYKLSTDCVTASRVNMFKNKVDTSEEGGLHVDEHCWGLDKPILVHLPSGPLTWMANLVKSYIDTECEHVKKGCCEMTFVLPGPNSLM